jgi:isopentenyl phosphate kinase
MNTTTKNQGGTQGAQTTQAKDQANQAVDKGREAASHAGEAVSHAASAVGQAVAQKAGEFGHTVAEKASEVGSTIGHKAEDATAAAGRGMENLADKVRDNAPQSGVLGNAGRSVASALDTAGHYVEDKNLSGMMQDVTALVKRNPIPALLIGLGVGFLIGRALSSSSRS